MAIKTVTLASSRLDISLVLNSKVEFGTGALLHEVEGSYYRVDSHNPILIRSIAFSPGMDPIADMDKAILVQEIFHTSSIKSKENK